MVWYAIQYSGHSYTFLLYFYVCMYVCKLWTVDFDECAGGTNRCRSCRYEVLNSHCFLLSHLLGSDGFPDTHDFFDFLNFLAFQLYWAILSQLLSSTPALHCNDHHPTGEWVLLSLSDWGTHLPYSASLVSINSEQCTIATGTLLTCANCTDANCTGANCTGTNCTGANCTGTKCTGADCTGTNLKGE